MAHFSMLQSCYLGFWRGNCQSLTVEKHNSRSRSRRKVTASQTNKNEQHFSCEHSAMNQLVLDTSSTELMSPMANFRFDIVSINCWLKSGKHSRNHFSIMSITRTYEDSLLYINQLCSQSNESIPSWKLVMKADWFLFC